MHTEDSGCFRCCQRRITGNNKGLTLAGDVIVGEAVRVQGQGVSWELSVLSTQFCCKPEIALKNKVS